MHARGSRVTAWLVVNLGTKWSCQPHAPAALPLGKEPPVPTEKRARLVPEPVWMFWKTEKKIYFAPPPPQGDFGGTWWRSWLMHCATSRKVTGSIPDGVTGLLH